MRIAAEGRDVVIADLLEEQGKQTAKEIAALGQRAIFCLTDVTIEEEVHSAVEAAIHAFKRLDILVCAAGVLGRLDAHGNGQAGVGHRRDAV